MNLLFFWIPILIILPALYFIFFRRARGGSGGDRADHVERPELTGTEQHKHRKQP